MRFAFQGVRYWIDLDTAAERQTTLEAMRQLRRDPSSSNVESHVRNSTSANHRIRRAPLTSGCAVLGTGGLQHLVPGPQDAGYCSCANLQHQLSTKALRSIEIAALIRAKCVRSVGSIVTGRPIGSNQPLGASRHTGETQASVTGPITLNMGFADRAALTATAGFARQSVR